MLPTTASSISASRVASASGCSRLTRSESACASACVRTMPIWMRNRPSGLAAAAFSPAEGELPRICVVLVQALVWGPGWGAARACGGVSIEAVVDGGAGGLAGAGEEPPNHPAKGVDQKLLDGGG